MRAIRTAQAALCAVLLLAGCDSPSDGGRRDPARLDVVSGDLQPQATVGAELPEALVVRVVDDRGRPVVGQLVNFVVTAGGGSVFAGSAITDRDGEARERWTLGTVAGDTQRVEARAVNTQTGQPVLFGTFRAVARPDAPSVVERVSPATVSGFAGAQLADSPAVRVKDRFGNGVPGVAVAWSVARGGGSVSPATSQTGSGGVARTAWTLGARVDSTQVALATVGTAVLNFEATPQVPPNAVLVKVSGDGQSAQVGAALAQPLVVRARLPDGRPIAGVGIAWSYDASVNAVAPTTAVTDAQGEARGTWTFTGGPAGARTVSAVRTGSAPAVFTATALPVPAPTITVISPAPSTLTPPSLRVAATCGGCVSISARVNESTTTLNGTGTSIDATATFTGPAVRMDSVVFVARNVAGDETVAVRRVVVDPTGAFTRVAAVPGRVLDYLGGRGLWLDSTASGRTLKIRTVASGEDETVGAVTGTLGDFGLHAAGAAYVETVSGTSRVYDFRGGARGQLASAATPAKLRLEGAWMVYVAGGTLSLRDAASGAEAFSETGVIDADVGANGTLAYSQGARLLRRTAGGTPEVIFTAPLAVLVVRTDGTAIGAWHTTGPGDVALRAIGPSFNENILVGRLTRGAVTLDVGGGAVAGVTTETGRASVIRPGPSRYVLPYTSFERVLEASDNGAFLIVRQREQYFVLTPTDDLFAPIAFGPLDRAFYQGSLLYLAFDGVLVSRGAPAASRARRR